MLSQAEKIYLNKAIPTVFKKALSRNTAFSYLKDDSQLEVIIKQLDKLLLNGEFIAIASAAGILTPSSAAALSNSDAAQVRSFVGFSEVAKEENTNLIDSITAINNAEASNAAAIAKIADQSGSSRYIITGAKTVTSCIRDGEAYVLGNLITQGDKSSNGILKTMLDCTYWADLKIDHYLTVTGAASDCGMFIPYGLAYSACVKAAGIYVDLT